MIYVSKLFYGVYEVLHPQVLGLSGASLFGFVGTVGANGEVHAKLTFGK